MKREFKEKLNAFGKKREPFFFVIDYAQKEGYAKALSSLDEDIVYEMDASLSKPEGFTCKSLSWQKEPPSKETYLQKFNAVIEEIKAGNTYMLNLTAPTKLHLSCDLKSLFYAPRHGLSSILKSNLSLSHLSSLCGLKRTAFTHFP